MLYRLNSLFLRALICLALVTLTGPANSIELGPVKLHGFLNQVYLNTTGNNYLGDTIEGSWDYREAGINLFYRPTRPSYLAVQFIHKDIGSYAPNEQDIKLDYGVFGYQMSIDSYNEVALRIGEMKISQGFYSDALDVPVNRPSILLPQVMYYDYTRNNFFSFRGFSLGLKNSSTKGDIEATLYHGISTVSDEDIYQYLLNYLSLPGVMITGKTIEQKRHRPTQINLVYTTSDMRWKMGALYRWANNAGTTITAETNIGPISLVNNTPHTNDLVFSIEHYRKRLTLTAEYYTHHSSSDLTLSNSLGQALYSTKDSTATEGYYLQGQYRFHDDWTGLLRTGTYKLPKNQNQNTHRSVVAGITWEPLANLLIRSEYHLIEGTALVNRSDNPDPSTHEKYWSIFGFSASYQF